MCLNNQISLEIFLSITAIPTFLIAGFIVQAMHRILKPNEYRKNQRSTLEFRSDVAMVGLVSIVLITVSTTYFC